MKELIIKVEGMVLSSITVILNALRLKSNP